MLDRHKLKTVLIGFGRVAAGYSKDVLLAKWFQYSTHAQVLAVHPDYDWAAVVETNDCLRKSAACNWGIQEVESSVCKLKDAASFEVAVIATPPQSRSCFLDELPSLKAVIVEKPLALNVQQAERFLKTCAERKILVQLNLPRRTDVVMREMAQSLTEKIGVPQAVFGTYGNGLMNNGTHMIDCLRMFLGKIIWVQAVNDGMQILEGPIDADLSFPFLLGLSNKICAMFQPLTFEHFRENSLDIWGSKGRLALVQEGLLACLYSRNEHRYFEHSYELSNDMGDYRLTDQGCSLYSLYDNLSRSLHQNETLQSDGSNGLKNMKVVDALKHSLSCGGSRIFVDG